MEHKEMNLFELCAAMFNGIGKAIMWLVYRLGDMLRLTYRQWWIVLIWVAIGLAAALYYARPDNRIYKVDAVARLNGVTNEMVNQEFQLLAKAIPQFTNQNLSQLLGVDAELAATNYRFETFDVIDLLADSTIDVVDYKNKYTRMDTLIRHVPNMIALQFRTKCPARVPEMQQAILNYLNNQPYFQALYARHRANLEREVRFHHKQVEKLDSLTSVFYYSYNGKEQLQLDPWDDGVVLGRREIELFLEDIYMEMRVRDVADAQLAVCTAPVVLRSDFAVNPRAINGPLRMAVWGVLIGWILGLMVAAWVENRKSITRWLKA